MAHDFLISYFFYSSPNVMAKVAENSRSHSTNTVNKMRPQGERGHLIAERIWAGSRRLGCSVLLGNSLRVILCPPHSVSWLYGQEGVHKVTWVNGRRIEVCVDVCEWICVYWLGLGFNRWKFFKADTNGPFIIWDCWQQIFHATIQCKCIFNVFNILGKWANETWVIVHNSITPKKKPELQ